MTKKYTFAEIEYVKLNYGSKTYSEMAKESGMSKGRLASIVYKFIPNRFSRGKSPFSHDDTRDLKINDDSFSQYSLLSCYWAGLVAADGNIDKKRKRISLFLQEKDLSCVENFKDYLKFSGKIFEQNAKYTYKGVTSIKKAYGITFTSKKIAFDLEKYFNITPKKSLTLLPPPLKDKEMIDAFIIGYIDGDGSISLSKSKKQRALSISLLGTLEVTMWIKNRFSEILGEELECVYKHHNKTKNTFVLTISDKRARRAFEHFYNINVPKLERKWSKEKLEHCLNYQKYRNIRKYEEILELDYSDLGVSEIAKLYNSTYQAILWYFSRKEYLQLAREKGYTKVVERIVSEKNKLPANSKRVRIGNMTYDSFSSAAKQLGKSFYMIEKMIKNGDAVCETQESITNESSN
jgi:hypothetical protein